MAAITWDVDGERYYETGVDHGVLYPINLDTGKYDKGVAWNGLINVSENPSGAEASPLYADNIKYLNLMSNEEYAASIEAYTYPKEFASCNGEATIADGISIGQQTRNKFGFCYRTLIGNDVKGQDYGYKLHLVYNCLAAPSEKSYGTVNESPEAMTLNWEVSTTPVAVKNHKPTAHLIIDSTKVPTEKMVELEKMLYGDAESEPKLPTPDEVAALVGTTQG